MKYCFQSLILFGIGLLSGVDANAQKEVQLSVNYNVAMPMGADFKEYVSKTSFRGLQASLLYAINEKIAVGAQFSYNDFYQKYDRALYKTADGSDISTVLSNTLQTIPLLAKGTYTFSNTGLFRPYVGLGAGVNLINYDQYFGEFKYSQQFAKPTFSADAGVLVPVSKDQRYGVRLSTAYNFTPFNKEGIAHLSTWNVQAGFFLPLR